MTHWDRGWGFLYCNANPTGDPCPQCAPLVGHIFALGTEPPLPAHPGCYCFLTPVWKKPTDWSWEEMSEDGRQRWVRHAAWRLRDDLFYPPFLESLREDAEEYNRNREEEDEHDKELPMPDDIVPAKNTPHTLHRIQSGRVLLQPADATTISGRREYECVFMQPGRVKQANQEPSNWLIPADPIRAAAHLFSGISSNLDHPEMFGFGYWQSPKVKNLAGITFDARWSDTERSLLGSIRLYDQEPGSTGAIVGALMDQILTDKAAGLEVPCTGLSAVVFENHVFDEEAGLRVTTEFTYAESVDFVYDAGAHGYVRAALSAAGFEEPYRRVWNFPTGGSHTIGGNTPPQTHRDTDIATLVTNGVRVNWSNTPPQTHGGNEMPNGTLQPNDGGTQQVPPPEPIPADQVLAGLQTVVARLDAMDARAEELAAGPVPGGEPTTDAPPPNPLEARLNTLTEAVEQLTALTAGQEEPSTIQGMGQPPTLRGGMTGLDQVVLAVQAMVDGTRPPDGIQPLAGIRELYHLMSGDYEMSGIFQEDRVYLANVTASTMAQIVANVLNKRVINLFQQYPRWWEAITRPEDFASLQQVRWITLGGIGELPTVEAGAAYSELTWDDLAQRDSFVKKGGYLGITLEAIDKDDTRKLTAAPRALAQAAWLTLSKTMSAIFTDNSGVGPNIYYDDSNQRALFHTSNSNLGTTALSWAAWDATRTAMRKQTEHNSDERLGALTAPRFLLVPSDLETAALQLLASEGEPGTANNDENPFADGDAHSARMRAARSRVIVIDLWTDTNNWAAVADPNLYATIGLGFRYGRTPEIFSVADPRAGLMFSNDVMPIKVRFFFAAGPMDYRGLYKHNVA